jgi:hypothetical protein
MPLNFTVERLFKTSVFVVGILMTALLLIGYDQTIRIGGTGGFEIGMSKKEVFSIAKQKNVYSIYPELDDFIRVDSQSIDRLSLLVGHYDVCVSDNSGFAFNVKLREDGYYDLVSTSTSANVSLAEKKWPLSVGDLQTLIERAINNEKHAIAFNCINGAHDFQLSDGAELNLRKFDNWMFFLPDSYSSYSVAFKNDKLIHITFHSRRSEF